MKGMFMNNSFSYSKLINQSIVFKMIGLKKDIVIWWVTPKLGWFWNVWKSPKISFSNFSMWRTIWKTRISLWVPFCLYTHDHGKVMYDLWRGYLPSFMAVYTSLLSFFLVFFLVLICFLSVCGIALSGRFIFMYCWEFYHVWVAFHSCASQPN